MTSVVPTKRHRIGLVITELEVGGAERCLCNLALRINKQRFDPFVCSLGPRPTRERALLVDQLEAASIPVHFLGARSAWQAWSAYRALRALLARQCPDLVQTFLFHANVIGAYAARAARVRQVVQGVRVADPARWRHFIERQSARAAQRIVCVSESVATFARQVVKLPANKLCVIPNGVDVSLYPSSQRADLAQLGVAPGHQALVLVGRLHEQKGIDWLLRCTPQLFQTAPHLDLLIVGQGPAESELKALAVRSGIASRVHFLGWRHDVPSILRACAVFVLPSRWEGMPNALLEAMASGLPVVATRAEGIVELLGSQDNRQLVNFGQSEALVQGIASVLNDPQQAKDLGARNRRRVADYFSLERMVQDYQELYESLLRNS